MGAGIGAVNGAVAGFKYAHDNKLNPWTGGDKTVKNETNLNKIDARIMEQNLINKYGLGKNGGQLYNKINSISPRYMYSLNRIGYFWSYSQYY